MIRRYYITIHSAAIHRVPIRQQPAITPRHCHRVLSRVITHASVINRLATPPSARPSTAHLFTPSHQRHLLLSSTSHWPQVQLFFLFQVMITDKRTTLCTSHNSLIQENWKPRNGGNDNDDERRNGDIFNGSQSTTHFFKLVPSGRRAL